jgi:hypothetical protein
MCVRRYIIVQPPDRLRWGRSTDADGDGDVRRLLSTFSCTDGLTTPFP